MDTSANDVSTADKGLSHTSKVDTSVKDVSKADKGLSQTSKVDTSVNEVNKAEKSVSQASKIDTSVSEPNKADSSVCRANSSNKSCQPCNLTCLLNLFTYFALNLELFIVGNFCNGNIGGTIILYEKYITLCALYGYILMY